MSEVKGKIEDFVPLLIWTIVVIIISIIYFAIVLVVVGVAADVAGFDDLSDSYAVLSASILVLAILLSSAISERRGHFPGR